MAARLSPNRYTGSTSSSGRFRSNAGPRGRTPRKVLISQLLRRRRGAGGSHMVFDQADAGDAFGGDDERPPLLFGNIGRPQIDDSVLHHYIIRRDLGPTLGPQ